MNILRYLPLAIILLSVLLGCGQPKTEIPTGGFTDEQKKAIQADDKKIADEESHGAKRR
jgi:hypothetical protein